MKVKFLTTNLIAFMLMVAVNAQSQYKVYTQDIINFWEAYDSVQTTDDKEKQIEFIQRLYVDRGTDGLMDFMESRGGNPERWQMFISNEKERFERIRPYTLSVLDQKTMIDESLERLRELYPDFKEADVFFTIGIGNSGGTITGNRVLIGCEVMASERPDWAVQIVMHEFIHTQQFEITSGHLLAQTIHEGMADFISELVIEDKIADLYPTGHIAFAQKNQEELWKLFKEYIYANDDYNYHGWMYGNGGITLKGVNMNDLGYGMGYLICKSYYENAPDKKAAIKEMLTIELNDENSRAFLLKSGFVPDKDIKFVENFEFRPLEIKEKKNVKKVLYGYKVKNNSVEFILNPKDVPFEIQSLTVAGSFNDWNPKAENYVMKLEKGKYVLRIPSSDFERGKKHYFKFVANGNNWLQPPVEALNAESDGSGNKNLFLEL